MNNTQKKLSIVERSFQVIPPVFGSHFILFQVPAVVRENIYIPSALEALFYDMNVFWKTLVLLFPQVWSQKLQFTWHSCSKLVGTLQ